MYLLFFIQFCCYICVMYQKLYTTSGRYETRLNSTRRLWNKETAKKYALQNIDWRRWCHIEHIKIEKVFV